MGRVHLFELEDQSWFPNPIRDAGTDFMRFMADAAHPYRPIVPRLRQALADTGSREILDLCSGAAGPIIGIREQLAAVGCPVAITLTDKFPNETALGYAVQRSDGGVRYIKEPVDAAAVPPHLSGFRTLFTALWMPYAAWARASSSGKAYSLIRRKPSSRSDTIFCVPTTRMTRPAPLTYGPSWLPPIEAASSEPASVTACTLPSITSGAALRRRISSAWVLRSMLQIRGRRGS